MVPIAVARSLSSTLSRRQFEVDIVAFHFHREDLYRVVITAETDA
jgi:hypothetical protein